MMSKGTILYIGTFQLPDKCAAAHRVLNIAKSLRALEYEVVLFGVGDDVSPTKAKYVEGFIYYDVFAQKKGAHVQEMFNIEHIRRFANTTSNLKGIIAYNYPSIALIKLNHFCKMRGIRLLADCTEWFDSKGRGIIAGLVKSFDTVLRMRYIHKRMDGLIVISTYLYKFYCNSKPTVYIPPTVDLDTGMYDMVEDKEHDHLIFVYSGTPSTSKEALDSVVDCFNNMQEERIELRVVGITKAQYKNIYSNLPNDKNITFLGRVNHTTALYAVKTSDYAIIIRPRSRLTNAGFPTKFAEAISCGVPVIATDTSDLSMYLDGIRNGCIVDLDNIYKTLKEIVNGEHQYSIERDVFDYHMYIFRMADFLCEVGL